MTSPAQLDRLTVSVALCTRNGERFVAEQVRSILAQRPAPLELVVGDDDSSDDDAPKGRGKKGGKYGDDSD